jgi:cyclic pyranopterin phosphate synthase
MCLGQEDQADLRTPLRAGASNDEIDDIIVEAISRKPEKHDFQIKRGALTSLSRPMSRTGG